MANKHSSNTLRIVGGEFGGRKLRFPDAKGLRPTADRVRETLFNWLQVEVVGVRCLDLFAGSGALGFEALSRGAAYVMMSDSSSLVVSQLQENAAMLRVTERGDIFRQDALRSLQQAPEQPFDLVFCDPPFADGLLAQSCALLESASWLSTDAMIYLEQDSSHPWPGLPVNWQLHREGQAGQAAFRLMRRHAV